MQVCTFRTEWLIVLYVGVVNPVIAVLTKKRIGNVQRVKDREFPIQHVDPLGILVILLVCLHKWCRMMYLACDKQLIQDITCDFEG